MSRPINKIRNFWKPNFIYRRLSCQSLISMVLKNICPFYSKRFQTPRLKTTCFHTQPIHFWTCVLCTNSCSCWPRDFSVWVINAKLCKTKLREWSLNTQSRWTMKTSWQKSCLKKITPEEIVYKSQSSWRCLTSSNLQKLKLSSRESLTVTTILLEVSSRWVHLSKSSISKR